MRPRRGLYLRDARVFDGDLEAAVTTLINLDRPLVFFDLETTGPEIGTDRIVQFAAVKLLSDSTRRQWQTLVNPKMPIPLGATKVHGLTDEMVKDAPTFDRIASRLYAALEGADLGGYNARRFDVPFLIHEFKRVGFTTDLSTRRIVDPMRIFMLSEPRDLGAAVKRYCGRAHDQAHQAMADTEAALDVFLAQLQEGVVPGDIDAIHRICADGSIDLERKLVWEDDEAVIAFGKNRGKRLRDLAANDRSFLEWMLTPKASFPPDTCAIVRAALQGIFPRRQP
jgi:DNA polymerase-3 subunit epsilon